MKDSVEGLTWPGLRLRPGCWQLKVRSGSWASGAAPGEAACVLGVLRLLGGKAGRRPGRRQWQWQLCAWQARWCEGEGERRGRGAGIS